VDDGGARGPAIVLEEHPGSTIVTDSVTSNGLAAFIAARGGRHHRFRRGYKNVISEGQRLNAAGEACELAIETSGHGAMRENYFLDDGAYLVAKVLAQLAKLNPPGAASRTGLRSLFGAYAQCSTRSTCVFTR
jgi:phosphomannomutase